MQGKVDGEDQRRNNSDNDGHGTHAVSVLIKFNPACEIYVAKVFEGRKELSGQVPIGDTQQGIADVGDSTRDNACLMADWSRQYPMPSRHGKSMSFRCRSDIKIR
jgi:hypothetical protein